MLEMHCALFEGGAPWPRLAVSCRGCQDRGRGLSNCLELPVPRYGSVILCLLSRACAWRQAAWAAAEEEQRAVVRARGEELSIDALNDMEVLGRNMTEALRLFPPLIMLLRAAKAPFAVTTSTGKTHVIPKASRAPYSLWKTLGTSPWSGI